MDGWPLGLCCPFEWLLLAVTAEASSWDCRISGLLAQPVFTPLFAHHCMQRPKNATPCRTAESHGRGATLVFRVAPRLAHLCRNSLPQRAQHQSGNCGCSGDDGPGSIGPGWPTSYTNRYARMQYRRTPWSWQASPSRSFLAQLPASYPARGWRFVGGIVSGRV